MLEFFADVSERCPFCKLLTNADLTIRLNQGVPWRTLEAGNDGVCSVKWANHARIWKQRANMTQDSITISPDSRFRVAMALAVIADALQIAILPLFVEAVLRRLMTFSIWVSAPCWFAFSAGTGNSCRRFLPNSCPESIWCLSGHWRLQTSIGKRDRSRSLEKKIVGSIRCWEPRGFRKP